MICWLLRMRGGILGCLILELRVPRLSQNEDIGNDCKISPGSIEEYGNREIAQTKKSRQAPMYRISEKSPEHPPSKR